MLKKIDYDASVLKYKEEERIKPVKPYPLLLDL